MATAPTPGRIPGSTPTDPAVKITVDGISAVLRPNRLGPADDLAAIRETGEAVSVWLSRGLDGGLAGLAVLFWLARRQNGEPRLKLSTVLERFPDYGDVEDRITFEELVTPEEAGPDPLGPGTA